MLPPPSVNPSEISAFRPVACQRNEFEFNVPAIVSRRRRSRRSLPVTVCSLDLSRCFGCYSIRDYPSRRPRKYFMPCPFLRGMHAARRFDFGELTCCPLLGIIPSFIPPGPFDRASSCQNRSPFRFALPLRPSKHDSQIASKASSLRSSASRPFDSTCLLSASLWGAPGLKPHVLTVFVPKHTERRIDYDSSNHSKRNRRYEP